PFIGTRNHKKDQKASEDKKAPRSYLEKKGSNSSSRCDQYHPGPRMNIAGHDTWIIAALGVITADLPQGNDLADTKRHEGLLLKFEKKMKK
ncbi:12135_t:CDS:2, partial [Racocetra persica]